MYIICFNEVFYRCFDHSAEKCLISDWSENTLYKGKYIPPNTSMVPMVTAHSQRLAQRRLGINFFLLTPVYFLTPSGQRVYKREKKTETGNGTGGSTSLNATLNG